MEAKVTVLKHEVRRFFPKGSTEARTINRVQGFATLEDGFQQPLAIDLPAEHPPLPLRADVLFRIVDVRAFDRQVSFIADRATVIPGPPTLAPGPAALDADTGKTPRARA